MLVNDILVERESKKNWFDTLNQALESEDLIDAWDISYSPISYGETRRWTWQDGSKYGRLISITRETDGRYERPVSYLR
jgi:hypothetical protein